MYQVTQVHTHGRFAGKTITVNQEEYIAIGSIRIGTFGEKYTVKNVELLRPVNAMERKIGAKLIALLLAAEFVVSVNNGGDDNEIDESNDETLILSSMFAADEDRVSFFKNGKRAGWVYLVYGNSGYDVVTDYTDNPTTNEILDVVNAYADKMEMATA